MLIIKVTSTHLRRMEENAGYERGHENFSAIQMYIVHSVKLHIAQNNKDDFNRTLTISFFLVT